MIRRYIFYLLILISPLIAADKKISVHLDTVHTTHYLLAEEGQNEGMGADAYAIEFALSDSMDERIVIGSTVNSQFNQCFMLGIHDDLYSFSENLTFEASYIYAGEFFFSTFENCGDDGIYSEVKKFTGLGFVPFLYYGFEYNIYDTVGLEVGLVLPGILVLGVQFHF